ncbi:MAG: transglycosylase domain-containing protein [Actinobacteria bacterium]|nr:transglycosylase domain-containing protein [Actinomycetota bacterium]
MHQHVTQQRIPRAHPWRIQSILVVISLLASGCYSYETRTFEITIPDTAESSVVVAGDGTLITTLVAPQNRTSARRLDEIPELVRNAVIAIEDERFYSHDGVDLKAIIRAARTNLEAGGISQGGSTITQQYVKLAIIENTEKTASRKLEEIWYALRLEDQYSKDFILLQYLNTVYFGHGAYGIKAAAQTYFNKDVWDLAINEAAMLAGLIQAPSRFNPLRNYASSLRRSHLVLDRMLANDFITADEFADARITPPQLEEYSSRLDTRYPAGHFVEEVRRWFLDNEAFGATRAQREVLLFEGGLRIETTIDLALQVAAEAAVERHLPAGSGNPDASVVVMDPQNGHVLAMVGGRDFFADDDDAKVNLAVGNGRQVGSAMKPVGLAAALEAGWEVTSTYQAPNVIEFEIPGAIEPNNIWRVSGGATGHSMPDIPLGEELPEPEWLTLVEATRRSINTVYAQLSMAMGAQRVANMSRRLGIVSPIEEVNSNILGTSDATLLDMTTAYSTFANRGVHNPPAYVTRVVNADGTTLWRWKREQSRILDPRLTDQLTWVLEGVLDAGTGHRAKLEDRTAAGKTGTTQNYADALFVGYTPQRATGVWVGYPEGQIPMVPPTTDRKVFGGTYPALIWKDVMEVAHFGLDEELFATPPPSSTTTTTRPPSTAVETPVLVGLSMDEAQVLLAATAEAPTRLADGSEIPGLPPIRITSVIEIPTNDSVPGTIIGQSPGVGSTILPAGSMVVEVAVQPPPVPVPAVVGLGVDEAGALLAESVLGYEITEVANPDDPDAPPETIWYQEPVPGTEVPEGSVVLLQVTPPAPPEPEVDPEADPEVDPEADPEVDPEADPEVDPEADGPPEAG